jgi:hypothetical protein
LGIEHVKRERERKKESERECCRERLRRAGRDCWRWAWRVAIVYSRPFSVPLTPSRAQGGNCPTRLGWRKSRDPSDGGASPEGRRSFC